MAQCNELEYEGVDFNSPGITYKWSSMLNTKGNLEKADYKSIPRLNKGFPKIGDPKQLPEQQDAYYKDPKYGTPCFWKLPYYKVEIQLSTLNPKP